MRKLTERGNVGDKRLLNVGEVAAYTGLGLTGARQWAVSIGAKRVFGARTLYDKTVIDAAIDKMGIDEKQGA